MNRINKTKGYEYKSFKMPSSIGGTTVCAETGKLPSTEFCTPVYEYFAPGTYPSQTCPGHPEKEEEARLEEEKKKQEEEEQKRQEELENGLLNPDSTPSLDSLLSGFLPLNTH